MADTWVQLRGGARFWEVVEGGLKVQVSVETVAQIEKQASHDRDHPIDVAVAVMANSRLSTSRKGHVVVSPSERTGNREVSNPAVRRSVALIIARALASTRWDELRRWALLMTEVPASSAHRGNGQPRHIAGGR